MGCRQDYIPPNIPVLLVTKKIFCTIRKVSRGKDYVISLKLENGNWAKDYGEYPRLNEAETKARELGFCKAKRFSSEWSGGVSVNETLKFGTRE